MIFTSLRIITFSASEFLKNLTAIKSNPYLVSDLGSPICAGAKLSPGPLPHDRQYLRSSSAKSGD